MERRDVLKYTAYFLGASLSSGTMAAIMSGCRADVSLDWEPGFFTGEQASFLDELGETIMPKTTTPGAKDAMVTRFIDMVRPLRYTAEDNEKFRTSLDVFIRQANEEIGKDFLKASSAERLEWVTAVDKASYAAIKADEKAERPLYIVLKEHILGGYFSSEIVVKEYFLFDPVPGEYLPCIPYEEVGKAWALG